MTIPAVDTVIAHMVLMAEGYGLPARDSYFCHKGGSVKRCEGGHQGDNKYCAAKNTHFRQRIRATMKYLSHLSGPTLIVSHYRDLGRGLYS